MTGQSPHPRIISAYAKERSATCQPSSSSHQRSNSLPLRQFVPERSNFRSTTLRPSCVAQGSKKWAEPGTGCALVPSAGYDWLPRQSDLDTASITAVKSRETLRKKKGMVIDNKPGVNDMSSIDEMVIASWGSGRKECLSALLKAQTASNSKDVEQYRNQEHGRAGVNSDRPASTPIPGHRHSGGEGLETSSDISELELLTPSASEFPLPPIIIPSWRDYHGLGGSKYAENIHLQSTAPLAIRKRKAVQNPNANPLAGTTSAPVETLGRRSSRRTIRQIDEWRSAEVRKGRNDDRDAELLDEMLTSGIRANFRASRCPPGIKGDPLNRF